jgi:hypothetical protein
MATKKRSASGRKHWTITVWDSTTQVFETRVPLSHIREEDLKAMLRTLAAKYGLNDNETLACYLSRRARDRSQLLNVRRENRKVYALHCGVNPYVTACVTDEFGKPLSPHERRAT